MLELLTACSLLILAGCAFFAWQSLKHAEQALDEVRTLLKLQGKLAAHDLTLDAHHAALKRIDGKIGALQQRQRGRRLDPDDDFERDERTTDAFADDLDPQLAAELALQRAPAASPGKPNGGA
jgi:hypothetical protein